MLILLFFSLIAIVTIATLCFIAWDIRNSYVQLTKNNIGLLMILIGVICLMFTLWLLLSVVIYITASGLVIPVESVTKLLTALGLNTIGFALVSGGLALISGGKYEVTLSSSDKIKEIKIN